MRLAFDEILSPIGTVVLVASAGRLCALDYEDCRDRLTNWLVHRYTTVIEVPTDRKRDLQRRIELMARISEEQFA